MLVVIIVVAVYIWLWGCHCCKTIENVREVTGQLLGEHVQFWLNSELRMAGRRSAGAVGGGRAGAGRGE